MQSPVPAVFAHAVACVQCRTKHVRCDSKLPQCGRCARGGIACQYIQSRRGVRGPKAVARTSLAQAAPFPARTDAITLDDNMTNTNFDDLMWMDNLTNDQENDIDSGKGSASVSDVPELGSYESFAIDTRLPSYFTSIQQERPQCNAFVDTIDTTAADDRVNERLIALFYAHFYPAHPFLVPLAYYEQNRHHLPQSLKEAVQLIGSHFVTPTKGLASV